MAKSFRDSMRELEKSQNMKVCSLNEIKVAAFASTAMTKAVVTTATDKKETELPYDEKYLIYTEYSDEKVSTIDQNKNIKLDPSQVNLTQEENSQYVRFKMFRRYDGIDQLKMKLIMHAVTPERKEVFVDPVNVQYDDEYIYFGVILPKAICGVKGIVQFEFQTEGANEKGNKYRLKTRRAEFVVEESLSGDGVLEPDGDNGWDKNFLEQISEKVDEANAAAKSAQESAKNAVNDALVNYYTKDQTDEKIDNLDLSTAIGYVDCGTANNK